jgi:hypothetical protein
MANSRRHRVAVLVFAIAIGASALAHARADITPNAATPHWLDQTVYRPNCPRAEYDKDCLLDGCSPGCGRP